MPFFYFDSTYILVLIGMLISAGASIYMQSTYNKYGQISNKGGISGAEFAAKMMQKAGIYDVQILSTRGNLSDNYNPMNKTLNLSETTHSMTTIGAIGVAGHEVGHAMQDAEGFWAMKLRRYMVPAVNFGSMLSMPIILLGIVLSYNQTLINIGILLFSLTFIFQVVTLPVEFGASRKALAHIESMNVLDRDELKATSKVLRAAALTYVAAATASLLSLMRLIILFGGRNRND
ncbi:zinc metallopeptidase [Fastidiosipila sanguinis]|uniref:Peptidase n=1 Tax=Fastidiosipila sanguinis TaxID=236753 RepID=A0A2S0KNN2_9FIRM|nr:zinc metallopeptidase [Fastidiosipila sanguinis]AVM42645.1 peptidase [Fastidiosipila sanguinis]